MSISWQSFYRVPSISIPGKADRDAQPLRCVIRRDVPAHALCEMLRDGQPQSGRAPARLDGVEPVKQPQRVDAAQSLRLVGKADRARAVHAHVEVAVAVLDRIAEDVGKDAAYGLGVKRAHDAFLRQFDDRLDAARDDGGIEGDEAVFQRRAQVDALRHKRPHRCHDGIAKQLLGKPGQRPNARLDERSVTPRVVVERFAAKQGEIAADGRERRAQVMRDRCDGLLELLVALLVAVTLGAQQAQLVV